MRGRRERLSIDLRGHGPALDVIAQSMQISKAVLVRTVLANWLKARTVPAAGHDAAGVGPSETRDAVIKMTLRLTAGYAAKLARAARSAEMSQGVFVARLIDGQAPVPVPPDLRESRAALARSTATLAAMSGDLQALLRFLRQPSLHNHAEHSVTLAQLADAINLHLATAAPLIAALKPSRRPAAGDSV